MSLHPRPELIDEGVRLSLPIAKLLTYVALFLRLSLGLGLVNAGLAAVLSQGGMGPAFGGRPVNTFPGAPPGTMPGMEGVSQILPFAELAVGVGLVSGIFTTICALAACALTLVTPLMVGLNIVTMSGIGPGPNRFGMGLEFLLLGSGQSTLAYAALVLLSPVAINRFSMDAFIFARRARPIFPEPDEEPAPTNEPPQGG